MPEGDVVWYTARRLHEALAGKVLTRSDFRVPRLATADLSGDVVTETVSRGKHLLTRTKSGLTVHTHLKMDGSWRVRPAAERLRDSHRIRLLLANEEWQAVGYQLGVVELIRTSEEQRVTGHLGPDLLGPDWDRDEAARRLGVNRTAHRRGLLAQRNLAGIGNVYKAGAVPRGLSPWQTDGSVPDLGARAGPAATRGEQGRFGHITTGSMRRGEVLGLRPPGEAVRGGTPIRSVSQDDRITFWCPSPARLNHRRPVRDRQPGPGPRIGGPGAAVTAASAPTAECSPTPRRPPPSAGRDARHHSARRNPAR
jgi:endonuclease-8